MYTVKAQKLALVAPEADKAVVYFITPVKFIPKANFQYFEKGNYIGSLVAPNYLRFECAPGKKLFWLKAEGKSTVIDFIEGELEAGKIYVIESWNDHNLWTVPASFHFVDSSNEKQLYRISTTLEQQHSSYESPSGKEEIQKSLQAIINESVRDIHKQRKFRIKRNKLKKLEAALYSIEDENQEK